MASKGVCEVCVIHGAGEILLWLFSSTVQVFDCHSVLVHSTLTDSKQLVLPQSESVLWSRS